MSPEIEFEKAENIAQEYALNTVGISDVNYIDSKLIIRGVDHLNLSNSNQLYSLIYEFSFKENGVVIGVDAISGTVVLFDKSRVFDGRSFYFGTGTFKTTAASTLSIMTELGYSAGMTQVLDSESGKEIILNYIRGSNSWAFNFNGHGNPNVLSGNLGYMSIYRSEIQGVWSFVYLDACQTATNTDWASAFQIYDWNNTGRSFLGWGDNVLNSETEIFGQYLLSAITTHKTSTLLTNVYRAIANIPDDNYYFIVYIGDRNTTGRK